MSVAESPLLSPQSAAIPQGTVLPTLFGEGYGVYRTRPSAFVLSYAVNFLVTALIIWSGHWFVEHRHEIKQQMAGLVTDVSPYILPPSATRSSGGGGGGGGVGSGRGPGVGPGTGGGIGDGLYRVGGGVSAPRTLYAPDPEYSEEARRSRFQGSVLLALIVGPDGNPRELSIMRSLGLGLDEKALDAVRTWRFEPARKDGVPVAVQISVEVNFRLY